MPWVRFGFFRGGFLQTLLVLPAHSAHLVPETFHGGPAVSNPPFVATVAQRAVAAFCTAAALLLVILLASPALHAQDTGYISGTVTDKSGAAIAGAKVSVTS